MVFNAHYAASSCTIKFISHTHTFVTFVRRFKRHISSIPQLAKQSIGSHHVFHSYQHSMCKTSTYLLIASFCTKSATTAAKYMWECKFLREFCWALYQMWSSLWYSLYLLLWISRLFSVFKPAKNKKQSLEFSRAKREFVYLLCYKPSYHYSWLITHCQAIKLGICCNHFVLSVKWT